MRPTHLEQQTTWTSQAKSGIKLRYTKFHSWNMNNGTPTSPPDLSASLCFIFRVINVKPDMHSWSHYHIKMAQPYQTNAIFNPYQNLKEGCRWRVRLRWWGWVPPTPSSRFKSLCKLLHSHLTSASTLPLILLCPNEPCLRGHAKSTSQSPVKTLIHGNEDNLESNSPRNTRPKGWMDCIFHTWELGCVFVWSVLAPLSVTKQSSTAVRVTDERFQTFSHVKIHEWCLLSGPIQSTLHALKLSISFRTRVFREIPCLVDNFKS